MPTTQLEAPRSYAACLSYVPGDALPRRRTVDRRTAVVIADRTELPLAYIEYRRRRVLMWLPGGRCMVSDGCLPRSRVLATTVAAHLPAGHELVVRHRTDRLTDWEIHFPDGGAILLPAEQREVIFLPGRIA